jgi:hypothetical protein
VISLNFTKLIKKFISVSLLSTLLLTITFSVYAESNTSQEFEDMFFKVFQEGKEVNKDSVGLNDFIIDTDYDYYVDIAFLSSVADFDNKLYYFVFDKEFDNPEELSNFNLSDIKESNIIFESIKSTTKGKSKQIGPFTKDEKVGFYIKSPEGDFYSIRSINENGNSHCAKYKDEIDGEYFVSLGFEDKIIENSDKDYKDTIFLINVDNYTFPDVPDKEELDEDEADEECTNNPIPSEDTVESEDSTPTETPENTTLPDSTKNNQYNETAEGDYIYHILLNITSLKAHIEYNY